MAFSGLAFGLPFAMNTVEGFEASMFVAAAASRSTWRKPEWRCSPRSSP